MATIGGSGDRDGDTTNAAVGVGAGEKGGDGTATAGGIIVGVGNTKAGVLCDPDGGALPHPAIPPAKTLYSLRAKRLRPTQAIDRSTIQPLRNDDASFLSDRFLNHIHARDHMVLQPRVQTGCVAFIDAHCFPSWKAIVMHSQQPFCAFGVRYIRRMHEYAQRVC